MYPEIAGQCQTESVFRRTWNVSGKRGHYVVSGNVIEAISDLFQRTHMFLWLYQSRQSTIRFLSHKKLWCTNDSLKATAKRNMGWAPCKRYEMDRWRKNQVLARTSSLHLAAFLILEPQGAGDNAPEVHSNKLVVISVFVTCSKSGKRTHQNSMILLKIYWQKDP